MGMMINFSEDKIENLSENIEQGLRYLGKAMQCIDEMRESGGMGERSGYGDGMGQRSRMGYRQGVRGTGPYGIGRRDEEYERPMDNQMGNRGGGGYRDPYYN